MSKQTYGSLDIKSKNGQTALILAVGRRDVNASKMLIKAGADVLIKDNFLLAINDNKIEIYNIENPSNPIFQKKSNSQLSE